MGKGSLGYEIIPPKIQRQECTIEIMRPPGVTLRGIRLECTIFVHYQI